LKRAWFEARRTSDQTQTESRRRLPREAGGDVFANAVPGVD
jgi:hypothetical protein